MLQVWVGDLEEEAAEAKIWIERSNQPVRGSPEVHHHTVFRDQTDDDGAA